MAQIVGSDGRPIRNEQDRGFGSGIEFNRRSLIKMAGMAGIAWAAGAGSLDAQTASQTSSTAIPSAAGAPLIFPPPRQVKTTGADLKLDSASVILLPENPTSSDLRLAQAVTAELSSRFDIHPEVKRVSTLPKAGRNILLGSVANPLVRQYCARENIQLSEQHPGPEGYVLRVNDPELVVAGSDERGAFYGFQSLRQVISKNGNDVRVRGMQVTDWPDKPFRGIYTFLPGPENLAFFGRFIRDFAAFYKFNAIMVEMNACMRLDRHPELNTGWLEFTRDTDYSRRNYPPGSYHNREQNSSHQDCGDGAFVEKSDIRALVQTAKNNHIQFVPVIQSLTHSFYLLTKHKELSEVPGDKWPDTYCASNPDSHKLLFEVADEFLDVIKPEMVHAGHDEWFAPFGLCPCCRHKDPGEVFGKDIRKIHEYLAGRNMKMAIWGDYLLENVRGKGLRKRKTSDGWTYYTPGAMTPQQVKTLVPKDILIFNWFWSDREKGRQNEEQLRDFGFRQVYGNMEPGIHDYVERSSLSGLGGGAPSSWAASTEFTFGKDLLPSFLGCSSLLWSKQPFEKAKLASFTQAVCPAVESRFSGLVPPSVTDGPTVPLDISASLNVSAGNAELGRGLDSVRAGRLESGGRRFDLPPSGGKTAIAVGVEGDQPVSLPLEAPSIAIGHDATSLVFLHACARPSRDAITYRLIWDEVDSPDLLGWYEVAYEDGLIETIPIRYGVNILEWRPGQQPGASEERIRYCYRGEKIDCGEANGDPVIFYAFEWVNPRLGKVIRTVRLRGSRKFRGASRGYDNTYGSIIPSNAIALKAISYVARRRGDA